MANEQKSELAVQGFKTGLIKLQDRYVGMITTQMADYRIDMDAYQTTCLMNAISAITNVLAKKGLNMGDAKVDQTSITQALLLSTGLRLNSAAYPKEVFFQARGEKRGEEYVQVIEMGIEGDGNDAILRRFGVDIKSIGQYWVVWENDVFSPPSHIGTSVEPPKWIHTDETCEKVRAVVYPIVKETGETEYHVTYRANVKSNLLAHISNNMLKETFGVCVEKYKASDPQKKEIAKKRQEFLDIASRLTLDEILDEQSLWPWISPAYRDAQSREQMIIRKMRNNIVKKIPKNFDTGVVSTRDYEDMVDRESDMKDIGGDEDIVKPAQVLEIPFELQAKKNSGVKPPKAKPIPVTEDGEVIEAPDYGSLTPEEDLDVFKAADEAAKGTQVGF